MVAKLGKIFLILISLGVGRSAIFLATNYYLWVSRQTKFAGGARTSFPRSSPSPQIAAEKIVSSYINARDCSLEVETTKRKFSIPTSFLANGDTKCYQFAESAIAPSKQYVAFEDEPREAANKNAIIRIYSLKDGNTVEAISLKPSRFVFDLLFLPGDLLAILSGKWGDYSGQNIIIIDINSLFNDYPHNVDRKYNRFSNVAKYKKTIELPNIGEDYQSLKYEDGKLKVFALPGSSEKPIREYSLRDLTQF